MGEITTLEEIEALPKGSIVQVTTTHTVWRAGADGGMRWTNGAFYRYDQDLAGLVLTVLYRPDLPDQATLVERLNAVRAEIHLWGTKRSRLALLNALDGKTGASDG